MNLTLPLAGYALASTSFLALMLLALTSWRGRLPGSLLILAALMSMLWGAVLAYATMTPNITRFHVFLVEVLRSGTWLLFLTAILKGGIGGARFQTLRSGGLLLFAVLLVAGIGIEFAARSGWIETSLTGPLIYGSLLLALYSLVLTEQMFRNARGSQRAGLKYLCLAIGGMFVYDLILYTNAILFGQIDPLLWGARGYVVAMCVPLIALAAKSTPSWSVGIFVSRQIVFHTATLLGAGIYMTSMAVLGYYIRIVGGSWGPAAQVVFIATTMFLLVIVAVSTRARSRLRVFISKHFYENKYDYRQEWLRLIDTLTAEEDNLPLRKRGIKALAQILNAPAGVLWLRHADQAYFRCVSGWNSPVSDDVIPRDVALTQFLDRTNWIIAVDEFRRYPERYDTLTLDDTTLGIDDAGYVIPLLHDGLLGFVVLALPDAPAALNFEDHDLLKTAGQQIASYLAQELVTEKLAESRQFETANKLTAYIMHDLKNVAAQQSLIVENAQKHKTNPQFIDDSIETLKVGVRRMRKVIEQLSQRPVDRPRQNIEIGKLVLEATSECADRQPVPTAQIGDAQVWVRGDRNRLLMALCHGIRNAQDATPVDGRIAVVVDQRDHACCITVSDTGEGMDERFIHDRLFRPFDTTKGAQGMGIGAHQIRETIQAMGGDVTVESRIGVGTSLALRLPVAERAAVASIAGAAR